MCGLRARRDPRTFELFMTWTPIISTESVLCYTRDVACGGGVRKTETYLGQRRVRIVVTRGVEFSVRWPSSIHSIMLCYANQARSFPSRARNLAYNTHYIIYRRCRGVVFYRDDFSRPLILPGPVIRHPQMCTRAYAIAGYSAKYDCYYNISSVARRNEHFFFFQRQNTNTPSTHRHINGRGVFKKKKIISEATD